MPNNEVSSTTSLGSSIALRLFYKNPYAQSDLDEYAQDVQSFTQDELYGAQCVEITCGLKSTGLVNITYLNGLLIIRTNADIDILLSGHSPAYGIHIETKGACAVVGGPPLNLPVGMYVKSNRTVVELPISSTGFITFISNKNEDSWVKTSFPVTADNLLINTPTLLSKSDLIANSGGIECKKIKVAKGGKIHLKDKVTKSLNFDDLDPEAADYRSVYLKWKQYIEKEIFKSSKSFLRAEKLIYEGNLVLENAIVEIKDKVHFSPGCNIELNNVDVFVSGIHIDKDSIVSGADTKFNLKENFDVDGTCDIDGLVIFSDTCSVTGVLWGGKSMHLQIRESASFHGVVGAVKTTINGKHLLSSAVLGNELLLYKTFVNGGIIGTSSLNIDVLTFVRAAGAYLYAPNMHLSCGVNVGLFSYIRTYNLSKNVIYDYDSLETTLICMPEYMSDLINPNKLLRVAEMIGSKFPILRGLVSAYNVASYIVPVCISTAVSVLTSIRNDSNPLRQMEYLASSVTSAGKDGLRAIHGSINNIINLAMGEWNLNKAKELVDIMLRANGMRVYGNVLMSQLTNSLVFVNDIQNHLVSDANLINDGSKATNNINENPTVAEKSAEENINIIDATKKIVLNEVSRVVNAPAAIYNDMVGAAKAIGRIDPLDSANKIIESYGKQVDTLISAGKSVVNFEPSTHPIQWPIMNEAFIWDSAKEASKLLGPSIYSTSFVSDHGGLTITGNYIVNTGFYRNRGAVFGFGTAVHSLSNINNPGIILSDNHTESSINRNNSGIVSAREVRLNVDNNNERGTTEATTRMIFDIQNQYIADGAKFKSTGQTFGHISGKYVNHGTEDLRNGYVKYDGATELGPQSNATLKKMNVDLKQEFEPKGKMDLSDVLMVGEKPAILKNTSDIDVDNVIMSFPSVHREDGSKLNVENVVLFDAEHVGSDLGSALNGTPDSLLVFDSTTLAEHGSHNAGSAVFRISDLDTKAAHRLAYGLGEYQNKTYVNNIFVATEETETLIYQPSARKDGALTTLLTGGNIVLPPSYQRGAQNLKFSTYGEAARFVAAYDGYGLPEISKFQKSISQNFYEEATKASAAGVTLGISAVFAGMPGGLIVALASIPIGLFTGHKARKAARKEQARINDELIRRDNIYRDIDQRLTAHDEKEELAELYNNYNSSRIEDLYHARVNNNSGVVTHRLTTQKMLQYNEDIEALYKNRRLESKQLHDERAEKTSKYISDRAEDIRKSLGFSIAVGATADFGSDGYNFSGIYSGSIGGNPFHVSVPIYDKTYKHSWPSQQPINMPSSHNHTYKMPDLPPELHENFIFATNNSAPSTETTIFEKFNDPDNDLELRYTDSSAMLFSQQNSSIKTVSDLLDDRGYLSAPGFRSVRPVFGDVQDAATQVKDITTLPIYVASKNSDITNVEPSSKHHKSVLSPDPQPNNYSSIWDDMARHGQNTDKSKIKDRMSQDAILDLVDAFVRSPMNQMSLIQEGLSNATKYPTNNKGITSPLEEGMVNSLLIGAGSFFVESGQGIKQFSMEIGEKLGIVSPYELQKYNRYIKAEHDLYASTPVANSIPGKVGDFGAGLLTFSVVPIGAGLQVYKLVASGAASGGLITGLQPVYDNGGLRQRAINSTIGLTTGAIMATLPASTMWMYHSLKGGGIIKRVNPSMVKFSQSSVNGWGNITENMSKSGWRWWLEPIDIVRMKDGTLITLDNTRLLAAHDAQIEIRAIIRNYNDPLPKDFINRFKTKKDGLPSTWGEAVQYRINNQVKSYINANENGSRLVGRGKKYDD